MLKLLSPFVDADIFLFTIEDIYPIDLALFLTSFGWREFDSLFERFRNGNYLWVLFGLIVEGFHFFYGLY